MPQFDPFFLPIADRFSPDLRTAIAAAAMPSLTTGPADRALATLLAQPAACQVSAHESGGESLPTPPLVRSGLWLLAGELDRSHTISQGDSSPEGSFWHAIMHRREGDYSNAAYWFNRVGSHSVFDQLAALYGDEYCDPDVFNDAVAAACRNRGAAQGAGDPSAGAAQRLMQIQWSEWQLLVRECLPA